MKKLFFTLSAVGFFFLCSCNTPMEWNDETSAQFKKQCLGTMAKQFKADNPEDFCDCFTNKLKEEQLGMMDIMKESTRLATDCGANIGQ